MAVRRKGLEEYYKDLPTGDEFSKAKQYVQREQSAAKTLQEAQTAIPQQPPPEPTKQRSFLTPIIEANEAFQSKFTNALTFGAYDAIRSKLFPESYARYQKYAEENPKMAMAGEALGMVAPGIAIAKGAKALGQASLVQKALETTKATKAGQAVTGLINKNQTTQNVAKALGLGTAGVAEAGALGGIYGATQGIERNQPILESAVNKAAEFAPFGVLGAGAKYAMPIAGGAAGGYVSYQQEGEVDPKYVLGGALAGAAAYKGGVKALDAIKSTRQERALSAADQQMNRRYDELLQDVRGTGQVAERPRGVTLGQSGLTFSAPATQMAREAPTLRGMKLPDQVSTVTRTAPAIKPKYTEQQTRQLKDLDKNIQISRQRILQTEKDATARSEKLNQVNAEYAQARSKITGEQRVMTPNGEGVVVSKATNKTQVKVGDSTRYYKDADITPIETQGKPAEITRKGYSVKPTPQPTTQSAIVTEQAVATAQQPTVFAAMQSGKPRVVSSRELPKGIFNKTTEEFDALYELGDKPTATKMQRLVDDVGAYVINRTGTDDAQEILQIYKQKYDLPENTTVRFVDQMPRKNKGANAISYPIRNKQTDEIIGYRIDIVSGKSKETMAGLLRHEIEHIKDLASGYQGTKTNFAKKPELLEMPMNKAYRQELTGHHKNYGWFEPDYLRRAMIKDALKEGKHVKKEVLDEYPDLKNVTKREPAPANVAQEQQRPTPVAEKPAVAKPNVPKESPEIKKKLSDLEKEYIETYGEKKNWSQAISQKFSYDKRKVIQGDSLVSVPGGLSAKELDAKIAGLKKNYKGKEVETPYGDGIVTGKRQSYNEKMKQKYPNSSHAVEVKFLDGTTKYVPEEQVTGKVNVDELRKQQQQAKLVDEAEQPKPTPAQPAQTTPQPKQTQPAQTAQATVVPQPKPAQPKPTTSAIQPKQPPVSKDKVISESFEQSQSTKQNTISAPDGRKVKMYGNLEETAPTKTRAFGKNVSETPMTEDQLRARLTEDPLMRGVLENKTVISSAESKFRNEKMKDLINDLKSDRGLKEDDAPLARLVANQLVKEGRVNEAYNVIAAVAEKLTIAGRGVNAAKIFKQSDPIVFVKSLERMISKINADGISRYGDKWKKIALNEELRGQILKSEFIDEAMMDAAHRSINRQIPVSKFEKMNALRRTMMLLNPKTHVRNILGNTIMVGMYKSADIVATGIESVVSKLAPSILPPELRTKSAFGFLDKELRDVAKQDFDIVKEYILKNAKYEITDARLLPQTGERKIFEKGAITRGLEKLTGKQFENGIAENLVQASQKALEKGDVPFLKTAYIDSLTSYMKSQGLKEVNDAARQYAIRRATEATYRQTNKLSELITQAKRKEGFIGFATEAIIPFAKTPANLLYRGIEYSPISLVNMLYKGAKGSYKNNPSLLIEDLSKGMTGTGIIALGMHMANLGLAKVEEKLKGKGFYIEQLYGEQKYSIEYPNGDSFTLDWAQPFAIPFFMGVALQEGINKNMDPKKALAYDKAILNALGTGVDTLTSLSLLQGITDLFNPNKSWGEKLLNIPTSYVEQFIPTLLGQYSKSTDEYKRETYSPSPLEQIKNSLIARTPIAENYLKQKIDIFGRPVKQASDFDIFFSPGNKNKNPNDPLIDELNRLYKLYNDTEMLPRQAPRKLTNREGNEVLLSADQVYDYQKNMGQENYRAMNEFISSKIFKNLSDEQRAAGFKMIATKTFENEKANIVPEPTKEQEKAKAKKAQDTKNLKKQMTIQNILPKSSVE